MRPPSVVYVTHPHQPIGVDYWRAINPAFAADSYGLPVKTVRLGADLPTFDGQPPNVLVTSQRGSATIGSTARLRERLCRGNRMLLVADCCDDPISDGSPLVQRENRTDEGHSVRELVIDHLASVDLVTVNSPAMAEVVRTINPHVEVMRDRAIAEHWLRWVGHVPEERPANLTIGVAGGDTHDADWRILADVWPRVAELRPDVHFVCVGHTPSYLRAVLPAGRFHSVPWANIAQYQANYHWFDIGCAPLVESSWNQSKSPIKFLEYTLAGVPIVASPTVYHDAIVSGKTGVIAHDAQGWVNALLYLLDNEKERLRLLEGAMRAVAAGWLLDERECLARAATFAAHYRRVYGQDAGGADHAARANVKLVRAQPGRLYGRPAGESHGADPRRRPGPRLLPAG